MLAWRLTLGTLFIAALVGLCWLDWHASRPGIVLLPLAIVLALVAAGELLAMFRRRGHQPLAWVVYAGTLFTVVASAVPGLWGAAATNSATGRLGWLAVGLAAGMLVAILGELRRYDGARPSTVNLSLAVFAILYAGGLIGFLVQLRLLGGDSPGATGHRGMLALVSLIAIVKMSDTGQYTAGRLFGDRKLVPALSPGKTWEGVLGGLLFAIVGGFVTFKLLGGSSADQSDRGVIATYVVYPLALAAAGIVGDLAESLLKRDAGVKDSSTWLPGFGGVLDLLDSLLAAAPVAYMFWALEIVG